MTNNDPLDHEVSVSAGITETGIEGKAKSRALSAFDRLVGNVAELGNVWLEERTSHRRAVIEGRKEIMAAAAATIAERIKTDPELAQRALEADFIKLVRRQENKEDVVKLSLTMLKDTPPDLEQADHGDDTLSPDFMNRVERLAEDASSDDVKEKWAAVLAAEIRKPGTFSGKALRVLDEIDSETANKFRAFCQHRIGYSVPRFINKPDFHESSLFTDYDLIVSGGLGNTVRLPVEATFGLNLECYVFVFERLCLSIPKKGAREKIENYNDEDLISWDHSGSQPVIPITLATSTGTSFMEIMEDNSYGNAFNLLQGLRKVDPDAFLAARASDGSTVSKVDI